MTTVEEQLKQLNKMGFNGKSGVKKEKKLSETEALQKAVEFELSKVKFPMRGARLAELVNTKHEGFESFKKDETTWHAGQLERLLAIPGLIMVKPKSLGTKVIREYTEVDTNDKTEVYFVLEHKLNNLEEVLKELI